MDDPENVENVIQKTHMESPVNVDPSWFDFDDKKAVSELSSDHSEYNMIYKPNINENNTREKSDRQNIFSQQSDYNVGSRPKRMVKPPRRLNL